MQIDIVYLLNQNPALILFTVLGFGYLLGNLTIRGVKLGATAGVLLAGLFFGHFGFQGPQAVESLGFILFIYSVGLQAGPRFFSVFLSDGPRYIALAAVVALTGAGLTFFFTSMLGFDQGQASGMLSGALTSTPTLAAAQDAVKSGVVSIAEGMTREKVLANISISYAIAYIYGLLGLITFIRVLPMIMHFDMHEESQKLQKERRMVSDEGKSSPGVMVRAYEVRVGDIAGVPLKAVHFCTKTECFIGEVKRDNKLFRPDEDTRLEVGDTLSVVGEIDKHERMPDIIGPEVLDRDLLKVPMVNTELVCTNNEVAGRSIGELRLLSRYGCYVTRFRRAQVEIPVSSDIVLEKGDVLYVSCMESRVDEVAKLVGYASRNVVETDLLTFAFGIAAGLVLGKISIKFGTLAISLGSAGGLLASGILIGFLRSVHPTFGRVPPAARWIFMELGLMFFMAGVGLRAGTGIVEALMTFAPVLFACGAVVTTVPVIVGYIFGRYVLRMNQALLMGAICGAMTSTPSLGVVTKAAGSSTPALGYAGTYTFANLFMAISGTLLMIFY